VAFLPSVIDTCVPREDVLEGGLSDKDFAAQLDRVVAGDENYATYTKADSFFALTYPTSGLCKLIGEVFGHLTGRGGRPVLRSQTSFGGGKTHSLIALCHLAKCSGAQLR
jgi:predicted AAA+ superfamily ATPase